MSKWIIILLAISKVSFAESTSYLQDGGILKGKIQKEDPSSYTIETTIGEMIIQKEKLEVRYLNIKLTDGSFLTGKLISENSIEFYIESSLGNLKVPKTKIDHFQFAIGQPQNPKEVQQSLINKPHKQLSTEFAPLIDLFFDPTGHTFEKSEIYLSGLSLAFGITNKLMTSINLVEVAGLNSASRLNPNLEIKYNLLKSDRYAFSLGIRAQAHSVNGTTVTVHRHFHSKTTTAANGDVTTSKAKKSIVLSKKSHQRPNIEEARHYDDYYNESSDHYDIATYSKETGFLAELYFANTHSSSRQSPHQWHLHYGTILRFSHIHKDVSWTKVPSYRIYTGLDLDLSSSLKILAEVFYDPDFHNWITGQRDVGVDFGAMYAFTENFRLLVHLQPYIVGFYWRF